MPPAGYVSRSTRISRVVHGARLMGEGVVVDPSATRSVLMSGTEQPWQRAAHAVEHTRPADAGVPLRAVDHRAIAVDATRAEQFDGMRAWRLAIEVLDGDAPAQVRRLPCRGPLVLLSQFWALVARLVFAGSAVHVQTFNAPDNGC